MPNTIEVSQVSETTVAPETITTSEDTQVSKPARKTKTTKKPEIIQLALDSIRTDGNTQSRVALRQEIIEEYAESMKEDAKFPPVIVFYDGSDYWLADGFHRYEAANRIKKESIDVEVKQGTKRDAVLHSVGANSKHGIRRNNRDKRNAILILLKDEEWQNWNDSQIGKQCNVDHKTVASIRTAHLGNSQDKRKVERNGTTYEMNTANIGQQKNPPSQQVVDKEIPNPVESVPEKNTPPVPVTVPDINCVDNSQNEIKDLPEENAEKVKDLPEDDTIKKELHSRTTNLIEEIKRSLKENLPINKMGLDKKVIDRARKAVGNTLSYWGKIDQKLAILQEEYDKVSSGGE